MINIERALQIPGWMSVAELTFLAEQASHSLRIIEVGSYKGRSSRALADNTAGVVYCVDPWIGFYPDKDGNDSKIDTAVFEDFQAFTIDLIESLKIVPFKMPFWQFITTLKFDMIFLDGDHRYDEVKKDIIKASDMLKPNGLLCGHDYIHGNWPGVRLAVDELFRGEIDLCDSIWYKRIP